MKRIRVLVIDDSALVREILSRGLAMDPSLEVVGTAPDVFVARDKIEELNPDVLTLDMEMPRMDGLEFLKRLMAQYPLPVVVVSSLTGPQAELTLEALMAGAVEVVQKPSSRVGEGLRGMITQLQQKVRTAALADLRRFQARASLPIPKGREVLATNLGHSTDKVIALGASTGGTRALTDVLTALPGDLPGLVVVQHMPPHFTHMFAEKLNEKCALRVREAAEGDRVLTGTALIAPGGRHMTVERRGGQYLVHLNDGEKVHGVKPAVDVLFHSLAKNVGANCLAAVMTGMGRDGATGLKEIRDHGGRTFSQDEASSVVYGMPKEAWLSGGSERQVSLENFSSTVLSMLREMTR